MTRGRLLLFSFTAVIFLLGAFSLLAEAPPLWVPWTLGAAYCLTLLAGVLNLRLQMFGDALCSVPEAKGQVALTFDDGPDPVSTPIVLAELRKAGAKATFFVIANKVAQYPELAKSISDEGHSLGVHSYGHQRLYAFLTPKEVARDIERSRDAIERATGQRPLWFRPPVGQLSPRTASGVLLADAFVVGWSVRARDGAAGARLEQCLRRVQGGLRGGAIVLLHDAWEKRDLSTEGFEEDTATKAQILETCPAGVRLLPELLKDCASRHLKAVTLEELLASEGAG